MKYLPSFSKVLLICISADKNRIQGKSPRQAQLDSIPCLFPVLNESLIKGLWDSQHHWPLLKNPSGNRGDTTTIWILIFPAHVNSRQKTLQAPGAGPGSHQCRGLGRFPGAALGLGFHSAAQPSSMLSLFPPAQAVHLTFDTFMSQIIAIKTQRQQGTYRH